MRRGAQGSKQTHDSGSRPHWPTSIGVTWIWVAAGGRRTPGGADSADAVTSFQLVRSRWHSERERPSVEISPAGEVGPLQQSIACQSEYSLTDDPGLMQAYR
jgi:hypothetical protein